MLINIVLHVLFICILTYQGISSISLYKKGFGANFGIPIKLVTSNQVLNNQRRNLMTFTVVIWLVNFLVIADLLRVLM